ncbi:MAG: uL30 family ribosomal protein [Candidatus Aenigmarchaeota archaeon]|nr:uL30 family ribosomal protein [Candidatus Aenigmarchaeota archaeon]
MMLVVVRIRGSVNVRADIKETLRVMGLKKINSAIILEDNKTYRGMIMKVTDFVAWGEADAETQKAIKGVAHLKPPRKGIKSISLKAPQGDLGYNGAKINELIKRML